jgi:hypothetical protein
MGNADESATIQQQIITLGFRLLDTKVRLFLSNKKTSSDQSQKVAQLALAFARERRKRKKQQTAVTRTMETSRNHRAV